MTLNQVKMIVGNVQCLPCFILNIIYAAIALTGVTHAQMPDYLPKNDVLGYWPLNGDARDRSGNGNNLTVIGPSLKTDGVGYGSSSYLFDGEDDWMTLGKALVVGQQPLTISLWAKTTYNGRLGMIMAGQSCNTACEYDVSIGLNGTYLGKRGLSYVTPAHLATAPSAIINDGEWHHYVVVMGSYQDYSYYKIRFFIDGKRIRIDSLAGQHNWGEWKYVIPNEHFKVGNRPSSGYLETTMNGQIDDICVWGRALEDQEVQALYSNTLSAQCIQIVRRQPTDRIVNKGSQAVFSVSADSLSGQNHFQWQSRVPDLSWISLTDNETFRGVQSPALTVSNAQPRHHDQEFRVLVTNRYCTDTSMSAFLELSDTCVHTEYDTIRVAVADTLYIDTKPTSAGDIEIVAVKIYPNPTASHLIVECADYVRLINWSIVVTDVAGRTLFRSAVQAQRETISISSLGAPGHYFVTLEDDKAQTQVSKIVVLR